MPSRKLPRTDESRKIALSQAKDMNDSLPPGTSFLSTGVIDRLDDAQPLFVTKMTLRGAALSAQTASTADTVVKKTAARDILSHYFQVFNMGITRGVYKATERGYFGIDISQTVVPDLGTEQKIITAGNNVINGDPLRVAAGGAVMANPATAEVTATVNTFKAANLNQSAKKLAFDEAQEDVAGMRPEIDSLILRLWNEIETYYSEEDPSSMRRKAREWGVVYTDDETEYSLEGQVSDTSGILLPDAEVMLLQTGKKVYTDENGLYEMTAVAAGSYDVIVSKEHYHTQSIPQVQIVHGETTVLDIQLLSMPGSLQVMVYSDGMPLPETVIGIEALGLSGHTGPDGIIFWENVNAGNWNVTATHPEKQPMTLPVTIQSDQTATLTFDMNNV